MSHCKTEKRQTSTSAIMILGEPWDSHIVQWHHKSCDQVLHICNFHIWLSVPISDISGSIYTDMYLQIYFMPCFESLTLRSVKRSHSTCPIFTISANLQIILSVARLSADKLTPILFCYLPTGFFLPFFFFTVWQRKFWKMVI